jgi:hypothetical protein
VHRRGVVVMVAAALICAAVPVAALGDDPIDQPAQGLAPAVRTMPKADVVSVSEYGAMNAATVDRIEEVGRSLGIPTARGRSYAAGVTTVWRGDTVVQQASGSSGQWQYPVVITALPGEALGPIMGLDVSATVATGDVVLSATGAALRTAQVGDVIEVVRADRYAVRYRVGLIAPDAQVGGAEIVMSNGSADLLGAGATTRVLFFGRFVRADLDAALTAAGLVDNNGVRVTRSWAPPNPDGLLGLARTKALLGEFDYRINRDDSLTLDPAWVDANIVFVQYSPIKVRASCHRRVIADLDAALAEIAELGLAPYFDVADTNHWGGCWNPRYARASSTVGSVSRHAWGMAFDMNVSTNGQGRQPRLDCRIVRIFRKHGFAWGGNFLYPDGMHLEWVGEPRNTWQYPSAYCPNLPDGGITAARAPGPVATARDTMFAD